MNDFFFRKIMDISQRSIESESVQHFKENIKNISKCLHQDMEMNRFKNIDKIMILIRNFTKELFQKRIKQITIALFEFLLNVLICIKPQVDFYFFDFFDPIILFYDDYDSEIKNACHLLNKVLLDIFISQVEKISKHYVIVKSIIKNIQIAKNENIRLLILEWIYVIDSFPCFDISYIFEQYIADLIYLFNEDNIEIVRLVKNKVISIVNRHKMKNSIDKKKIFKVMRNVYLVSTQFEKSKNFKSFEKNVFFILMEYFEIFIKKIEDYEKRKKDNKNLRIDLNLIYDVFEFMIRNVYLKKYKVQKNLTFRKKCYKKIKYFISKVMEVLNDQIVMNMKKSLIDNYKNFVKVNNSSDFGLFYEINGFLRVFSKSKNKIELSFIRALTKLFWYILKNNKKNFKKEKFQYFISEKIAISLEELFTNNENAYDIFLKNLIYIIFENKHQIFVKPIFIHLLGFFRKNLELYEILQLFTQCSIFLNLKKFLRFFFEQLQQETDINRNKISNFIFQKNSTIFTNILFNNPLWFILINISLKNFEFCCLFLKHLIDLYQFQSFDKQINFANQISKMLFYLDHLIKNYNYYQNFYFLKFISISLMIIPQNDIFKKYKNFLKNHSIYIKKKDFQKDPKQSQFFQIFLEFSQTENKITKCHNIINKYHNYDDNIAVSDIEISKKSETQISAFTNINKNFLRSDSCDYKVGDDQSGYTTPFSVYKAL